ncbi:MAG: hypothetical protein FWE67_07755, partial [Planctomycetaceae bacterium]|nr:hypothetical protein [Planctomycetaceae bacterium]
SKKKKKKLPDSVNMSENISDSELGEGKTVVNSSGHTQFMPPVNAKFWFIPIFILFGISGSSSLLYAEDEVLPVGKIDAEFVQTQLLQTDEYIWDALGDAKVPLEQQRDSVLELLDRLRRYVSAGFMKENITASFPNRYGNSAAGIPMPLSVLTSDPAQYRGKVFRLTGTLVGNVEIVPLNPAEQKAMEIPAIYRCRISIGSEDNSKNNIAEVLTAFAPHSLCEPEKKNVDNNTDADNLHLVRKRVAVTGIYIKRLYTDDKEVKDDSPLIPLLVSTRLEWFPDNYLGSLGMDFGTFEQVPVLSITDMKEKNLKNIPFSLSLLSRGELIRRAFKFTAADKEPFYGMLRAAKNTPKGRIEQEARNELQQNPKMQQTKRNLTSAVLLFNKPAEMQGKPVLLTGTAKRVMLTLVEDEEVKKLYGIDRYYQIYLFTEDSQSNPLVVCTTSLPEGMPVGSAPDYAEIISVGAFPYKLWVYETSKKLEEDENQQDSYKRGYAPMLVGRCPVWHSKPKEDAAKKKQFGESLPNEVKSGITVTLFVALLCVWIFLRRVKMYRTDSDPPRFNWRK